MENRDRYVKDIPENNQAKNDIIQSLIHKSSLIEEKFNQVNKKLDTLKAEADKLLYKHKL